LIIKRVWLLLEEEIKTQPTKALKEPSKKSWRQAGPIPEITIMMFGERYPIITLKFFMIS